MTNRRKSAKARASLSKKTESPEKQSRRVTRRTRRSRKSESPEQPEELGSEYSVDENTEDDEGRSGYDHDRDNEDGCNRESDQYEGKSVDDQKTQLKEEESGGSDGSWKVKSENGGSGGIPKLKLCLTRPPDMSSPTSEQPSPRRRRRGRGASQFSSEQNVTQEEQIPEEKESPKRNTRSSQRAMETVEPVEIPAEMKQVEMVQEEEEEERETVRSEVCDSTNINHSENEDETQMAVDSIIEVQKQEETEDIISQGMSIQNEPGEEKVETTEEKVEQEEKRQAPYEIVKEVEKEEKTDIADDIQTEITEPACVEEEDTTSPKEVQETVESITVEQPPVVESVREIEAEKRSPSRDSSEERAKEAALKSRNRFKKMEGSEDGEVVESPASEKITRTEDAEKSQIVSVDNKNDVKENQDDSVPAKANSRKRRWGASTSRVPKKPPVSISTDFLKEIIPEVKPLPMSEVQLSPNDEEEEGQVKEGEDNMPTVTKKVEREKMVQSDESEKDYEEEAVESGTEDTPKIESAKATPQVKEKEFTIFTRKVSVLPSNDLNKLQRSPSPPRHKPSNILYIVNLVRPFTIPQLRELLARTGTIMEDGFWIDKIKSRCYVKYETEEEAKTTRHALHGVRWPVSNPKQLNVDFGSEAAMKAAQEGNEILQKRPIPSLFDKAIDVKSSEKARERDDRSRERKDKNDKDKKEQRNKDREDEKREEDDREKKVRPPVEPLVRDRTVRRVTVPIREWDVGKNEDGFSPPPDGIEFGRHREDRYEKRIEYEKDKRDEYDERRRRDKDKGRRSISNEPPRKSKKKNEDEAPAKLLDDLFRKTKATPCIYWLPLTAEQIAVKEELRRKHMAEHEKRVAEMRKIQRDQNKRSSDKRRHRSKSRSRSRSPKK